MDKTKPLSDNRDDAAGFAAVIEPHVAYLLRLAHRFTGGKTDADDLAQEVMIKVYAQWRAFAVMEKPRAWLARVTYNTYIDSVRRDTRSPLAQRVACTEGDNNAIAIPLSSESDTAAQASNDFTNAVLKRALAQLPPDQRALVALHDIEGYTLIELESVLDAPLGTLKSRLHRARAQLREILDTFGTF